MDTTTYAILLKKIKASQGANATPKQVQAAVNDYLTKNPVTVTETATPTEMKAYLGI